MGKFTRMASGGRTFIKKTGRGFVLFFHPRYVWPIYVYWFFLFLFYILHLSQEETPNFYGSMIAIWTDFLFVPIITVLSVWFFVKRKPALGFVYIGHMLLVWAFAMPALTYGPYLSFGILVTFLGFLENLGFISF